MASGIPKHVFLKHNFILPNGTWLGANDSSKALGFVVLSPVATLYWEIHTTAEL